MEIKYTNNRKYYVEGYDNFRKISVKSTISKLIVAFIGLTILDWYYKYQFSSFYNIGPMIYLRTVIVLFIIAVLFTFIANKLSKKNIEKLIDKFIELGTMTIEEKTIEITEDKLIFKGKSHRTEYNMKAFDEIFETENVIVICVQKFTPAVVIPKSAFENEEMKNQFINLIKEKSDYIK